MKENITIQMIADELGISRNTVSKVINNKKVPIKTKNLVIAKAIELGYKGFSHINKLNEDKKHLNILLLAGKPLTTLDFFTTFVKGVENLVTTQNIDFFQYIINASTGFTQLNKYIQSLDIDGIIGIELYDKDQIKNLLSIGIPIVFIDSTLEISNYHGLHDTILMQSRRPVYEIAKIMIDKGINRLSFCGDHLHCVGFNERFMGVRDALNDIGHRMDLRQSLLFPDNSPFGDLSWLSKQISMLPNRPQAIFCVNDSIAVYVILALKRLNLRVPEDVQVIGFDNTIESSLSDPGITTVSVDKELLGTEALFTLINRINRPESPNRMIYIDTTIVKRGSTLI